MNPIAEYYRNELKYIYRLYISGVAPEAELNAIADEWIAYLKSRKRNAPKGSSLTKLRIPNRGYLIRAAS